MFLDLKRAASVRLQFSVEQRNFIAMSFERNKHQYTKIQLVQEEFMEMFPFAIDHLKINPLFHLVTEIICVKVFIVQLPAVLLLKTINSFLKHPVD